MAFVTVISFPLSQRVLAYVLQGRLEAEGIVCLVADGNTYPSPGVQALVAVQVAAEDLDRALEIVNSDPEADDSSSEENGT